MTVENIIATLRNQEEERRKKLLERQSVLETAQQKLRDQMQTGGNISPYGKSSPDSTKNSTT